MEHKLQKLNTFKSVTMTVEERNMMRAHGAHVVTTMIPVITESLFHSGVQYGLRIALSTFLFIVFVGGSVSVIANSALPGDPLYTFKVNVNEEVKGLFLNTPEEKVIGQKNRIERRIKEINTLAESKTLTSAKQATVQKAISSHVESLSRDLSTLSTDEPGTATALTVTASLEVSLKANQEALEQLDTTTNPGKNAALKTVSDTLEKLSQQEVKIIAKEIETITNDISDVSTTATHIDTFTPATTLTVDSSTSSTPVAP